MCKLEETHSSLSKLKTLQKYVECNTLFNSVVNRVLTKSIKNLDFRRQIIIECIINELQTHFGELSKVILEGSPNTNNDISQFFSVCFEPIKDLENCKLQDLFIDIFFINGERTISDINEILNKPKAQIHKHIDKFFEYLRMLVEEIYIALKAININCELYIYPCDCNKSDFCCCEHRNDKLILYYSDCYYDIGTILSKYLELGKRYFPENTIELVIDLRYIPLTKCVELDLESTSILESLKHFYKKVTFKNARINKLIIPTQIREIISNDIFEDETSCKAIVGGLK